MLMNICYLIWRVVKVMSLIRSRKEVYRRRIQESLANVRSSKEFWDTVRTFTRRSRFSEISVGEFELFLRNVYPLRDDSLEVFYDCLHPFFG